MPPRSSNRKAKKSTPISKQQQQEPQSSSTADVPTMAMWSPIKNIETPDFLIIEDIGEVKSQEDNDFLNEILEGHEGALEAEKGIMKENEGLEENVMEVDGFVSEVVEVKVKEEVVQEEKSGDIFVDDYLNLNWEIEKNVGIEMEDNSHLTEKDVSIVVTENSNLNGGVIERENNVDVAVLVEEEEKNVDAAVLDEEGEKNVGNVMDESLNSSSEDISANGGVVGEETVGSDAETESEDDQDGHDTEGIDLGAENKAVEEETPATHCEETIVLGESDDIPDVKISDDGEEEDEKTGDIVGEERHEYDREENDLFEFINHPLNYRKAEKVSEIHIGGLDKGAVEDDLIKIFAKFGEIQNVRIARNTNTKKSKGFGFIRYATVEQAKNALSELKDGIEVRGKQVKISASQDNDTLYMGNICKTWTKEKVLETLKGFGIQQIQEIHLPYDPMNNGKNKGFAFMEFSTHSDAMTAFQRLIKPDAIFGCSRSAKVAFASISMHPSEEALSQMKTVHVKGLSDSWDEGKVKEISKQYGEIESVKLSRNLKFKHKDFGFVTFTSRESALACIEGINGSHIAEGEVEVKANIARPQSKGRLQMTTRGGFKLKKKGKTTEQTESMKIEGRTKFKEAEKKSENIEQAGSSKIKGQIKSRGAEKKGKEVAKEKKKDIINSKSGRGGKPNKYQNSVSEDQGISVSSKLERKDHKRKSVPSSSGRRDRDRGYSKRPSMQARGDMRSNKQDRAFRNPMSNLHVREGPVYVANSVAYRNPYASASATTYPARVSGATSGSKRRHSDMEPHAGFLEPAVAKHGPPHARYVEPTLGTRSQPHVRFVEPAVREQDLPRAGHVEHALGTQGRHHGGYFEPPLLAQRQPHGGYLSPAGGRSPYDYELRRVAGYDGQGSRSSAYAGGLALPPSHVQNYTSYAGYEGGRSVGDYYQSSGAYQPRRAYY